METNFSVYCLYPEIGALNQKNDAVANSWLCHCAMVYLDAVGVTGELNVSVLSRCQLVHLNSCP